MQNLRNKKNKLIKNRLTNIEDNLVTLEERRVGELGEWGEGLKKYKLVVDRWSQEWRAQQRECSQQ